MLQSFYSRSVRLWKATRIGALVIAYYGHLLCLAALQTYPESYRPHFNEEDLCGTTGHENERLIAVDGWPGGELNRWCSTALVAHHQALTTGARPIFCLFQQLRRPGFTKAPLALGGYPWKPADSAVVLIIKVGVRNAARLRQRLLGPIGLLN